ncbi:MAG: tryptophan 2,3-dioxygenase family protein [Candidatus Poseidoniaceae archaeon]|nr:tryptophan 2,3-dioxygenase family protein [Candidatus Poseidoniaceae archaeon]
MPEIAVKVSSRMYSALIMTGDTPATRMTYGNYLRLDELLNLQDGPEGHSPLPCNDEMHFIIVHQAFELWFKLLNRELEEALKLMNVSEISEENIPKVVHHLERCSEIFWLLANQWKVMETLAPQDFLAFRDRLGTSSGFESWQMRSLEMLLGLDSDQRIGGTDPMVHNRKLHKEGKLSDDVMAEMERISSLPSLNDVLERWLSRTPVNGVSGDVDVLTSYVEGHLDSMVKHSETVVAHMVKIGHGNEETIRPRLEAGIESAREFLLPDGNVNHSRAGLLFIESYRDLPLLSWPRRLIDTLVELEESMILFRTHHARMVERMIGRRMGTGGSSGVDYLDMTLKYRIFKDLWAVRTMLVKQDLLPDVGNPSFYGFALDN